MSCRVQNNKAILDTGKESELFKSLIGATQDIEAATNWYEELHSKDFKDWFGRDWEKDYKVDFFTDENGEPKLIPENGYFSIKNSKGKTWELPIEISESSTVLKIGSELQGELINTIIGFINKTRIENPNIFRTSEQVEKYFGLDQDTEDKGDLADKILVEAFNGLDQRIPEDVAKAKELYNILSTQGKEAFVEALPENVSMNSIEGAKNNASSLFLFAYHNWNSSRNSITGNIEKVGVREILKDSLSNYGMKLQDRLGTMEEFDDTPQRIHNISRLQDNPKDKLSTEAKAILGNIELENPNSIGYPQVMSMDRAYSLMAEASVGEPTYQEMKSKLDYLVPYKPEVISIINKLNTLTAKEESALFTNFKTAYNNFILFKSERVVDEANKEFFINKIINSNQSNVSKKSKVKFRQNSRETQIPNERAIYKIDLNTNKISVKEDKLARLESLWDTIFKVKDKKNGIWGESDIDALGEYLWILGMQYGPTLETTQQNLKKYYRFGNEEGLKGNNLFDKFVFTPGKNFNKFLNSLKADNPKDIYREHSSLIDTITDVSLLFDSRPFGSFISGTNKQYYPINLPTRLHELISSINNPKEANDAKIILNQFLDDPLFRPFGNILYSSPLVSALHNSTEAQQNFVHEVLDSYKAPNEWVASSDYENQSSKISLIERFIAFQNRGKKDFTKIAIPIQAGRQSLDFITIPRISSYKKFGVNATKKQLLEGLIIQDLARIKQAEDTVLDAFKMSDPSNLIEGYHYLNISDPYNMDGSAFTMTQIYDLENTMLKNGSEMTAHVQSFVTDPDFKDTKEGEEFTQILAEKVRAIENNLLEYEQDLKARLVAYNINIVTDVNKDLNTVQKQEKFFKDFIFENFIGKIEITKMLRSGFSFAKDTSEFYKRMSLLKTPGNKLFEEGMSEIDPNWGMPSTYNSLTIRDFDFTDEDRANKVADNLQFALSPVKTDQLELFEESAELNKAVQISNKYRPFDPVRNPDGVNKSDAQSFISLKMYRNIMQGMGQWNPVLDEQAYKNAFANEGEYAGKFVDNAGRPRPIYPLKPFHEEISLQNGVNTLFMDKNSYTVVTPELASNFKYLGAMLEAMNRGIDVVNTISATKGARKNIQDFQNSIDENGDPILNAFNPTVMNSSMLRFPQLMPRTIQNEITFNRQLRKNIIANIQPKGMYKLGDTGVLGSRLVQIYGDTIAVNIAEDKKRLDNELGITTLKNLRGKENTKEYRDAKLNYLIQVRKRIAKQVKDKDLPTNYLEALNIVPYGAFDWRFKIPLAFPNYQAKFEGIFMSMYNNELFNQKLKGKELVQIAELGGHIKSGELRMYDGTNMAEVRVKASALGLPRNAKIEDIDPKRLMMIGYRIPQQGKNSSLVMKVVDFLPESHEKAIMVPGAITVQMGSDFDIDKLNIILPEVDSKGNVIKPDYTKEPKEIKNRKERNNIIFDVFDSILTDSKHLDEIMKPLDIVDLEDSAEFLEDNIGVGTEIDYNNPLSEIDMEERTKDGDKAIGLWANQLSGRNVAETTQVLRVKASVAPEIDDKIFIDLGQTKDILGNYTDSNISQNLSAGVDSAKNPIQIKINDNIYTVPVTGLFYSLGIPIETAINFVNQPIIREVIQDAKINSRSLGAFKSSIDFIASKYKWKIGNEVTPMLSNELKDTLIKGDITDRTQQLKQLKYLENFYQFYLAGRALQTVNKIITPDNLDNVNELSSVIAWIDQENLYLNNPDSLITGAEDLIIHNKGNKQPLNPIGVAYRSIFDTILEETKRLGFVNNSPAFNTFKNNLKNSIGVSRFTAAQHKAIDRALFLKIMTQPHSPFVDNGIISGESFKNLFINPNNNIITRLRYLQEAYPELNNNLFIQSLEEDSSNTETGLFLLQLDIPFGASTSDKNEYTESLRQLIQFKSEDKIKRKEVRDFGKILIANQLLTSGFIPTFGSYIDLIPAEVHTTRLLNSSKESPVEFFRQEMEELNKITYFDDFIHEFIRTYGTQNPGGVPFLKTIKRIVMDPNGFVSFNRADVRIYGDNNMNVDYFLSYTTGEANIFVNYADHKYRKLLPLGKSKKINESGISVGNSESLVNFADNATIEKPGPRFSKTKTPITKDEDGRIVRVLNNKGKCI